MIIVVYDVVHHVTQHTNSRFHFYVRQKIIQENRALQARSSFCIPGGLRRNHQRRRLHGDVLVAQR